MIFHMVGVVWWRLVRTGVFRCKLPNGRWLVHTPAGPTLRVFYMCYLCCDFYKWLDIRVFSDKDGTPKPPFHSSFTVLIFVERKITHTAVRKE